MVAFLCYYRTLLPGLDLGDSASFQTVAGSLTLNPRQAYPLYFGLGNLFVWLHPGEPARAMNLASAVYGAIAVGLAACLTARLSESIAGGIGAGLFLAFSYTFWTQAITAEVYTLHLMMVGAAALAAMAWADRQTTVRLALFYAIFALGFGNHLSMVLLAPAFTLFLLMSRRRGPGDPLQARMVALATVSAFLGALQYAWNFRGLWAELDPPVTLAGAVSKFWFDVTKADWRETLVMTVSETGLQYRPAMYWFDLRQQFGIPGVALASIGFCYVLWRWPRKGLLLLLLYAANLAFAWTYNVGDAYIFFLPAHYVVALCAGAGVAALTGLTTRISNPAMAATVAALVLLYPAWRGYDTFPAVDRSWDNRAVELFDDFIANIGDVRVRAPDTVIGLDANWQAQNAVEYYMRERRPEVVWFTSDQFEWLTEGDRHARFNRFVSENAAIGRRVIVSARGAQNVLGTPPPRSIEVVNPSYRSFSNRVELLPPGTAYVLAVLRADREYTLDAADLASAWKSLTSGSTVPDWRQYTIIIGRVGERPVLVEARDRPYRVAVRVDPFDFDVRMESWLPTDTIRRAGFGHVIVNRRHLLTLERGISFVALGGNGGPVYDSGLFAPIIPNSYP